MTAHDTDPSTSVRECPECGAPTTRDAVDIGVGVMYGPAYCIDCGWSEDDGRSDETLAEPDDADD